MRNEPMSSLTHFVGFLLAIAVLVVLVVFAALKASAWHVVSFAIFGSALILVYLASASYHIAQQGTKLKKILQRIDHAMIYLLIAGTYTPVCLLALQGGWSWSLFGVVWGIALIGLVVKLGGIRIHPVASALLYLAMGWLVVIAAYPLVTALSAWALYYLVLGGVLYSLGVIFFALDQHIPRSRWFGMHEVFHLFVLGGSAAHVALMFQLVA